MKNNHFFFYLIALGFIALSCDPDPVTPTYPQHFMGAPLTPSPNSKIYLITDDAGQYKEINNLSWKTEPDTALAEYFGFVDSIELPHAFTLLDASKMEIEMAAGFKIPSSYTSTNDGLFAQWVGTTDSFNLKVYWGLLEKELQMPLISHIHSKGTGKVNQVLPLFTDAAASNDLVSNVASIIQTQKLKKNDTLWVNWSHKVYTLK